jgi:hypothetical protein
MNGKSKMKAVVAKAEEDAKNIPPGDTYSENRISIQVVCSDGHRTPPPDCSSAPAAHVPAVSLPPSPSFRHTPSLTFSKLCSCNLVSFELRFEFVLKLAHLIDTVMFIVLITRLCHDLTMHAISILHFFSNKDFYQCFV